MMKAICRYLIFLLFVLFAQTRGLADVAPLPLKADINWLTKQSQAILVKTGEPELSMDALLSLPASRFKPVEAFAQGTLVSNLKVAYFRFEIVTPASGSPHWIVANNIWPLDLKVYAYEKTDDGLKLHGNKGYSDELWLYDSFRNLPFTLKPNTHYLFFAVSRGVFSNSNDLSITPTHIYSNHLQLDLMISYSVFGLLLGLLCYNVLIGLRLRRLDYVYFCCYLFLGITGMAATQGLFHRLIPNELLSSSTVLRHLFIVCTILLNGCSLFFSMGFISRFLKIADQSKFLYRAMAVLAWTTLSISLCLTVYTFFDSAWAANKFRLLMPFVFLSTEFLLIALVVKRASKRNIAVLISYSCLLLGATIVLLTFSGILSWNPLTKNAILVAMAIELFLLSYFLADKIKNEVEFLHQSLADQVEARTKDIRSIMKHVPMGIFVVENQPLRIKKPYSSQLNSILDLTNSDDLDLIKIFTNQFLLNGRQSTQLRSILELAFGEDILNFEINQSLLPTELSCEAGRSYRLTWSPVLSNEGLVSHILVTIEDVSHQKNLEKTLGRAREETELVEEMLSADPLALIAFFNHAVIKLNEVSQALVSGETHAIGSTLLELHTMKGSAGSLGLIGLAERIHDAEDEIILLKNRYHDPATSKDLNHFHQLQQSFDHYLELFTQKIGRSLEKKIAIPFTISSELYTLILKHRPYASHLLDSVAIPILQAGEQLLKDSHRLASKLDKPKPQFHITGTGYIDYECLDRLLNLFPHLLRNSLDHGIETAAQRTALGKQAMGTISLHFEPNIHQLKLIYRDDGRGLNLNHIKETAIGLGFLSDHEASTVLKKDEIAGIIFHEGFTTRSEATDISGRGVGLAAVKQQLLKNHGRLDLHLEEDSQGSTPFALIITLERQSEDSTLIDASA